jgi:MFS family permease
LKDGIPTAKRVFSGQNLFVLTMLALGHTLMHSVQQGWYIVLPSVKETFGLSDVQYGAVESVRSAANSMVQFPSGAVSDILRKQWVIILASSLIGFGAAYGILGFARGYGAVLFSATLIGISIALWHPAALSILSARLSERRGLALSIHGMGGNLGNAVGPAAIGIMLGAIAWQPAARLMAWPTLIFAILLWRLLRSVPVPAGKGAAGRSYRTALTHLLKNRTVIGLVAAGGIRSMGASSVFVFFSLYCREDLGFGPAKAGLYYALMMGSGIISQPVLGYLSDRFGRKAVLIPSLVLLGAFLIVLVWSGTGLGLAFSAVSIGLFIYAVSAIIQAAVMDIAPADAGATAIALVFGVSALFTVPSPMIAGWLSETYGTQYVFLYSGVLVLLSAIILMFLPMNPIPSSDSEV